MTTAVMVVVGLVALKAIFGYQWPWETCACCGRKIREHKRVDHNEILD